MLTPDYYETCVDDILKLYEQLENDIISDIIRRMMKTGIVTESAKHQAEMLQNAGLLYDDILTEIAKRTDATSQHVKALFEDAGVRTVNFDNQIYRAVGRVPVDIRQSPAMRQTLEAGYRKTLGEMKNLTGTLANTSQNAYYSACNQAYMQVVSGAFSYQEAIKKAVQKTAQDGAFVLYPSGHRDRVDVAVRRSVLTGVGQTCREIGLMNAEENDCDLMELSAHFGARPTHAELQGQIVSLSGRKGYLSLSDIGYGTGDGFFGWNCRHDWCPYFEGYSRRNYTDDYLKSLNEKNIEYNGEKYNQYEISQIQRRYEREIRSAKREKIAFDTAVKESSDSELKAVMQSGSNYANQQIKEKQAKMRDFIQQTGQSRDYFREQNYGRVTYPKNTQNNMDYMSRFTPKYSEKRTLKAGNTISISTKIVSNSRFTMFTDTDADRKNPAVRLTEKILLTLQNDLPRDFKIPPIAVIDFDRHGLNKLAIGGYDKTSDIMYINSKYDTIQKILDFLNEKEGRFANITEYAPFLHEFGHKYYEDSIKRLAISQNMSYNDIKRKIDRKIYDYIESKGGKDFLKINISQYAFDGYNKNSFTEVIAECFSVKTENVTAKEILNLLEELI